MEDEVRADRDHQPWFLASTAWQARPGKLSRGAVRVAALALAAALASAATACSGTSGTPGGSGTAAMVIRVVAAERLWGSIAAQIGGKHASVTSVISNPAVDPRSYRATAADRHAFAAAQLLILNGAGYDPWADQLANSTPGQRRTELNVGDNVGVAPGGNPYVWYDPDYVQRVAALIIADYARIDPHDAAYFGRRLKVFEDGLIPYEKAVFAIKGSYSRTPVGSSTPIAVPFAAALGLRLVSPVSLRNSKMKLYIYDRLSPSPAVHAELGEARAHGIPVVGVSAALTPVTATFQQWQAGEVMAVARALAAAHGR
jgi:zinc/manganese transport system substrate-binding protein